VSEQSPPGTHRGTCERCGDPIGHATGGIMCAECILETPGEADCDICERYSEQVCGYHGSCWWYCPECGYIRMVGNHPSRPGSDDTVGCYNHPVFDGESHEMVRLTYKSTVEPRLRRYIATGTDR